MLEALGGGLGGGGGGGLGSLHGVFELHLKLGCAFVCFILGQG